MKEGFLGVIEHVLESPQFRYAINKFCDSCLATRKVLRMLEAKELVNSGGKLGDVLEDGADHGVLVDEAMDAFSSLDSVYMLELEKVKHVVQAHVGAESS